MTASRKSAATPAPTRRERRAAARSPQRAQARTAQKPLWRSPIVTFTVGALVVGVLIVAYALLTQPKTSPSDLTPPAVAVPAGLADGRTLGSAQAPVTVDVWADFQCPGCGNLARRVEPVLISQYVATGMARLVYHDAAYQGQRAASAWDESVESAAAARCASDQGLFWQMHDWLFANQGENVGAFAPDRLRAIAQAAGLDMAKYDACMNSPTYAGLVRKETVDATAQGVDVTPTLFINTVHYTGAMTVTDIGDAIVAAAGGASRAAHLGGSDIHSVITQRVPARRLFGIHPAIILGVLDLLGLIVAAYLAVVELSGGVPTCGLIQGCEEVAKSQYNNFAGIPVAVFGVVLSVTLLSLAVAWWKTDIYGLLLGHYGLSLIGVMFDGYFLYLQVFVIKAVCIWCLAYEFSLLLRFLIAFVVWYRQPRPEVHDVDEN